MIRPLHFEIQLSVVLPRLIDRLSISHFENCEGIASQRTTGIIEICYQADTRENEHRSIYICHTELYSV
jgi:hypothetical protein